MLKFKLIQFIRFNYFFGGPDGDGLKLEKVQIGGTLQQLQGRWIHPIFLYILAAVLFS